MSRDSASARTAYFEGEYDEKPMNEMDLKWMDSSRMNKDVHVDVGGGGSGRRMRLCDNRWGSSSSSSSCTIFISDMGIVLCCI